MPENDPKLEGALDNAIGLNLDALAGLNSEENSTENGISHSVLEGIDESSPNAGNVMPNSIDGEDGFLTQGSVMDFDGEKQSDNDGMGSASIDESVFLESGDSNRIKTHSTDDLENFGTYLRWFFFSSLIILLSLLGFGLLYSFNNYITYGIKTTLDFDHQKYLDEYKDKLDKVKNLFGINYKNDHDKPLLIDSADVSVYRVNDIINATDIDYIEKKDLLSNYVSNLVSRAQENAVYLDSLKQDIAKQGFLPEELEIILEDEEAIDTIQRSLNALEVIKFSTATKVFSYMNTALATIAEMVRVNGSSVDSLNQLFVQLNSRGEKDISSYVYMCHLNPFETSANCDTVGDLDLYYSSIIKDNSINVKLFKNSMSAISQLLEKEDTSLFSITFNGFNAQDENIIFNIEVYTSQDDEKTLMLQGKKNPNIFILTNIINLLKQSRFIIGAEINTKEINVESKNLNRGGITRTVNYSSMDFSVPVQKDTEREIFDYIDLDSIQKMILDRKIESDEDS